MPERKSIMPNNSMMKSSFNKHIMRDDVTTILEMNNNKIGKRNDDTRRSLKEAVLMRQIEKNRKLKLRRSLTVSCPPDGAKESSDNSDLIREKLLKNRKKLEQLLSHVPDVIVKSQRSCLDKHLKTTDDLKIKSLTLRPDELHHVTGSAYSHADDSSSDEELREPMAESLPNLSDEDSVESYRTPSPQIQEKDDVISNDETPRLQSQVTENHQQRLISVARTSSRTNFLLNQRGKNPSPTNPLYEAAKPRPPPRRINDKRNVTSKHCPQVTRTSPINGETVTQSRIVTLPYVSRSTSKAQLRRSSRSDSVSKDTCDVTIKEDVPLENTKISNDVLSTKIRESTDVGNSKDSSPSRITLSSSGYSSPGSSNCSGSLSPSTSNASSTTSSHSFAPSREHVDIDISSTRGRTEEPESQSTLPPATSVGNSQASNPEEDDVFPITSWVESEECKELLFDESNKKTEKSNEEDIPSKKRLSSQSDELSLVTTSQLHEKSRRRPQSAYVISGNKGPSHAEIGMNSVCMVEDFSSKQQRHRTASNHTSGSFVKMRFPLTSRSKKEAASRNSLAFAMQAHDDVDTTHSNKQRKRSQSEVTHEYTENKSDILRASSLSPKTFASDFPESYKREISASLAHLDRIGSPQKSYNTISGATGRHLSETSTFFQDEHSQQNQTNNNKNNNYRESSQSIYNGSTWSLDPKQDNEMRSSERKPSLRNRLKGAFSFQNIRKAISMERLDEDERTKSVSHYYLNEFGEDISEKAKPKAKSRNFDTTDNASGGNRLYKAPSISSIFSTVRMRKRKSRERRAAKARNTIAVDPKQIPEYETVVDKVNSLPRAKQEGVGTPGHFRPIGRVLQMNPRECTLLIEMVKPPSGPFGFYLARRKESGSVYISSMSDSYPDKMYAGLMKLGDEITEINGTKVDALTLDQIYDVILDNDRLVLRIKPSQVHSV